MKTRNHFRNYESGDVCTGLLATLGLSTSKLQKEGIIELKTIRSTEKNVASTDEWVFLGFDRKETDQKKEA